MPVHSDPVAGRDSADPLFLGLAGTITLSFFGVFLPALTLVIELITRICSGIPFDPVPTVFHIVLIALVPLVNVLACSRFVDGHRMLARDERGRTWQDESIWFWSAAAGDSDGPWRSIIVADRVPSQPGSGGGQD